MLLHKIRAIKDGRIITNDNLVVNININTKQNEEVKTPSVNEMAEKITFPFEYKGYTIKQNEEDGILEVYDNGGSILRRCDNLKIAADFIDGIEISNG